MKALATITTRLDDVALRVPDTVPIGRCVGPSLNLTLSHLTLSLPAWPPLHRKAFPVSVSARGSQRTGRLPHSEAAIMRRYLNPATRKRIRQLHRRLPLRG
jgi:hypothetical protein